jgi:hypothetical protein
LIHLLSGWEERVVGIHEGAEVGKARGELRERMEPEPGHEETSTHEGLE